MKSPLVPLLLVALGLLAAMTGEVRAQDYYTVDLSGTAVVPPSGSPGQGEVTGYPQDEGCYYGNGGSLNFVGYFYDLLSPPIAVEIRGGTYQYNGPLYRTLSGLTGHPGAFEIDAAVSFTPGLCDSVNNMLLYMVVTTEAFPNGEIRGQIVPRISPTAQMAWGRLKLLYR